MRVVFVGQDRVVWRKLVAYVLTFGISRRIWLYRITKELDGHEVLGLNHKLTATLLCLPIIGPSFVAFQTARRTSRMLQGSGIPFGPGAAVWAATLVPILGNLFFIAWEQSRLNRFWAYERGRPGHGIEIDVDLGTDRAFLIELGNAVKESYYAGSGGERKRKARDARWAERVRQFRSVREERAAVRAAGGSTPVLPWLRPQRPPVRLLHITCGRCSQKFDITQDPLLDTPVVCPKCALTEVLPGLHSDPLARREPAAVPVLHAKCPDCKTSFEAVRNLAGPTPITCPQCGRAETLAPRSN